MKKVLILVALSLAAIVFCVTSVSALEIPLSGAVQFKCNFLASYMEKHGYAFIETSNKKNIYAANDAEVIVKDKNNRIAGKGTTDKNGNFTIAVPVDDSYKIIVRFHGHESEHEYTVSSSKSNRFVAYLGYFTSEEVGSWIDAKLNLR